MDEKIILFPKMRMKLEQEIESEIQQENYSAAIKKLELLRKHKQKSYTIYIQSLICYIRLHRYTEAELLCEELLEKHDEHYMDYLDYYIIILFEARKYQAVIERIQEEEQLANLPEELYAKFQEMKMLAQQMNEWEAEAIVGDIQQAVTDHNSKKQYYLLQKWRQLHLKTPQLFYGLLMVDSIHPVIKTIILKKLMEEDVAEDITITKFTYEMNIRPNALLPIEENPIYQKTMKHLQQVEQQDPTLFGLMKEVYHQYCYVIYPFFHKEDEIEAVIQAITQLVQIQFEDDKNNEKAPMLEQIQICCHLYQDIMLQ